MGEKNEVKIEVKIETVGCARVLVEKTGLSSRKSTYCSLVNLGGVITGKSNNEERIEKRKKKEKN